MDVRKRPRLQPPNENGSPSPSPTVALLQTQLTTLRTQLTHSQSMRTLERKSYTLNEERLKRQVADVHSELEVARELNEEMRGQMESMEDQMEGWMERVRNLEEQDVGYARRDVGECEKCSLLQQRLNATMQQVDSLTKLLTEAQENVAAAEMKASNAELKLSNLQYEQSSPTPHNVAVENCNPAILRSTRISLAEAERSNRELMRQNDEMKERLRETTQYKEKAASSQRRVQDLEKEVAALTHRVEIGEETERRWMQVRREFVEEGLVNEDEEQDNSCMDLALEPFIGIPPEIATVVRKIQSLKHSVASLKEEKERLTTVSDDRSQRCSRSEKQLKEKEGIISSLEKEAKSAKDKIAQLELENRKIAAQQVIWKREAEGMRSLLDTYEMQETSGKQVKPAIKAPDESSPTVKGLQLSLKSAQEETKLLTETNQRLESELDVLRKQQQESQTEHEQVLEKFAKLRSALMDERSKAQAAEERACHAETLAGKGSYNPDTTRVLHLESNPLSATIRGKYQAEIETLKQKLEDAEHAAETSMLGTTTPAPTRRSGSFGSGATHAISSDQKAIDAQIYHKRLKERFREQIALFREGVYLITGCKIDMNFSDSDCPHFKVRSIYNEQEDDHLMFQWKRKGGEGNNLDLMSTDLAQLLMNGPSAIYMTKFSSVPAFMASVTLALFEKQTMI